MMMLRRPALMTRSSRKSECHHDADPFQSQMLDSRMHDRYLADRKREIKEHAAKKRGPIEKIARFFGWHPPRKPGGGGSAAIRAAIEQRERQNRGILDPRTSHFVNTWDLVILFLLLFTTLVTPYEVPPHRSPCVDMRCPDRCCTVLAAGRWCSSRRRAMSPPSSS